MAGTPALPPPCKAHLDRGGPRALWGESMRTRGHTQTLMPTDVSSPPLTPACITDTTTGPPAALPAHLLGSQMGSCGQRGPGMDASIGKGTGSWHLPPISALGHSQDHHTLPSRVHISGHGMPALGPHPLPRPESSLRPWLTMSQVDTLQGCWTARKPPLCGVGRQWSEVRLDRWPGFMEPSSMMAGL